MFKAPTQTPHISTLLNDLPTRDLKKVARHLGLSVDTIQRYQRTGNAPRLVLLALFWETRWGQSVLDCDIWNRDTIRMGQIRALEAERDRLREKLQRLVALGNSGAANDGLFDCERTTAASPITSRPPAQPPQLQPPGLVLVSM